MWSRLGGGWGEGYGWVKEVGVSGGVEIGRSVGNGGWDKIAD